MEKNIHLKLADLIIDSPKVNFVTTLYEKRKNKEHNQVILTSFSIFLVQKSFPGEIFYRSVVYLVPPCFIYCKPFSLEFRTEFRTDLMPDSFNSYSESIKSYYFNSPNRDIDRQVELTSFGIDNLNQEGTIVTVDLCHPDGPKQVFKVIGLNEKLLYYKLHIEKFIKNLK